jgi:hypothetical protein
LKKIIIILIVLGCLGYLAKSGPGLVHGPGTSSDSGAITNPVFAEVRFQTQIRDRTFHMVAIAKARDDADCKHMTEDLPDRLGANGRSAGTPVWSLESSECKTTLDARNAKLFENKPTFVNYVSATPGAAGEREVRIIFWGVTAQEGELVCAEAPEMQKRWSGTVTCVHAIAPQ